MITLRSALALLAITVATPIAAYAQSGGVPSSTAPSNSEGTPSSSTGVIGTTKVAPTATTHARRHRHHRVHHHAATTTGQ